MKELEQINRLVETTNTVDFQIQSFDSVNLMITGSFDFSYYHEVEFTFHEVSYVSLPSDFSYPIFRIANSEEIANINNLIAVDEQETVFCIEAETSRSVKKLPFFVVSEKISMREGLVFYYKKENLKKGERIAPWVKDDS